MGDISKGVAKTLCSPKKYTKKRYIWAILKVPKVKNGPFFSISSLLTASLVISLITLLCVCPSDAVSPPPFNNLQHVNLYGIGMRTDVCSRAKERIRKEENKVTSVCHLT